MNRVERFGPVDENPRGCPGSLLGTAGGDWIGRCSSISLSVWKREPKEKPDLVGNRIVEIRGASRRSGLGVRISTSSDSEPERRILERNLNQDLDTPERASLLLLENSQRSLMDGFSLWKETCLKNRGMIGKQPTMMPRAISAKLKHYSISILDPF